MKGNLARTDTARQEMSAYFCQLADSFGLPRSVALIYGTLFLAENPLPVSEIIEESGLSKGSVSSGLRFLERMGFIHLVVESADRRTFYRPELSLRRLVAGLIEENFTPALKRGGRLLDEAAEKADLSDHLKTRLASLRSWNETALGLLPAVSLLD
ncbi:ArsR family transcriptional regulator [Akkermansiaceae bacterium]|nr:ArsR family transcriptional regulator [Akkermansiaceae bacterium]MDA7933554.1 ArsR family transcriptional regulator [Akkermansiaceae bacterium]MDB4423436.1 ArsR family transcriptional regulator [bacterium]